MNLKSTCDDDNLCYGEVVLMPNGYFDAHLAKKSDNSTTRQPSAGRISLARNREATGRAKLLLGVDAESGKFAY